MCVCVNVFFFYGRNDSTLSTSDPKRRSKPARNRFRINSRWIRYGFLILIMSCYFSPSSWPVEDYLAKFLIPETAGFLKMPKPDRRKQCAAYRRLCLGTGRKRYLLENCPWPVKIWLGDKMSSLCFLATHCTLCLGWGCRVRFPCESFPSTLQISLAFPFLEFFFFFFAAANTWHVCMCVLSCFTLISKMSKFQTYSYWNLMHRVLNRYLVWIPMLFSNL